MFKTKGWGESNAFWTMLKKTLPLPIAQGRIKNLDWGEHFPNCAPSLHFGTTRTQRIWFIMVYFSFAAFLKEIKRSYDKVSPPTSSVGRICHLVKWCRGVVLGQSNPHPFSYCFHFSCTTSRYFLRASFTQFLPRVRMLQILEESRPLTKLTVGTKFLSGPLLLYCHIWNFVPNGLTFAF